MNPKELINKHEEAIKTLEGVKYFRRRAESLKQNINGFCGTFPRLKEKYTNELDTVQRCAERLTKGYRKQVKEL